MRSLQSDNQRGQHRVNARIKVRFSINGGPARTSDTINFTARSLAIRSGVAIRTGDQVLAHINRLPPLHGEVKRVFKGGFAMTFDEMSHALFAHISPDDPRAIRAVAQMAGLKPGRMISPIFRLAGPAPAWARIASTRRRRNDHLSHFLSIITAEEIDIHAMRSAWVSVDQSRWLARVHQAKRRGNQAVIVLILNDWQLRLASTVGMRVNLFDDERPENLYIVSPRTIRRHFQLIKLAALASAQTKTPRTAADAAPWIGNAPPGSVTESCRRPPKAFLASPQCAPAAR